MSRDLQYFGHEKMAMQHAMELGSDSPFGIRNKRTSVFNKLFSNNEKKAQRSSITHFNHHTTAYNTNVCYRMLCDKVSKRMVLCHDGVTREFHKTQIVKEIKMNIPRLVGYVFVDHQQVHGVLDKCGMFTEKNSKFIQVQEAEGFSTNESNN